MSRGAFDRVAGDEEMMQRLGDLRRKINDAKVDW
jgi:hypothetical protein